jgi:hypothetical protein
MVWSVRSKEAEMKKSGRPILAGAFLLLAAALPLAAQWVQSPPQSFGAASGVFGPASGPAQSQVSPMGAAGCPVSLKAQHKADGSMVRTGSAHPKGVGQWLHLTLASPQGKQVTSAIIKVHGFSGTPHVTDTSSNASHSSSGTERTLTVPFTAAGQAAEADVWVPGMTAVETIDLDSVSYADGAVWSQAGGAGCRITPEPFMPIAGR